VWFSDPKEEYVCEETGEEVGLMKDKSGHVIGFEKGTVLLPFEKGNNSKNAVKIIDYRGVESLKLYNYKKRGALCSNSRIIFPKRN